MGNVNEIPYMSTGNLALDYRNIADPLNHMIRELQWMLYNMYRNNLTKTTTYTVQKSDRVILCDATGGVFTVTLPPAQDMWNKDIVIKKIDVSANAVTVDGDGAETIEGSATQSLASQYDAIHIISNGTAWYKI